ncbi:MAG: hypothetical protein J6R92_02710 [Akkermansia sp.]|nr:hypothetical protein [Akkermansia sp.]
MEHPGHIWNSIETTLNQLAGHILPAPVLRWGWVLVHAGILCGAGMLLALTTAITAFCVSDCILTYQSEPIYAATPDAVNPAHEGKLVKLSGIITTDTMTCDPLTGVQVKAPILTRTTTLSPDQKYDQLEFIKREEIEKQLNANPLPPLRRDTTGPATSRACITGQGQLGAFRIPHFHWLPAYIYYTTPIPAKDLTFTQAEPGYQIRALSPESPHIVLSTEGGEDICYLQYYTGKDTFYIIARQYGNQLDLSDPDAYISTYESPLWDNRHRVRTRMLEGQEIIGLLFMAITAHFILIALALSSLRSGVWNATASRVDILRLPLLHMGLLLGSSILLTASGIFLMAHNDSNHITPGIGLIMAAVSILCYTFRRWQSFANTRGI